MMALTMVSGAVIYNDLLYNEMTRRFKYCRYYAINAHATRVTLFEIIGYNFEAVLFQVMADCSPRFRRLARL